MKTIDKLKKVKLSHEKGKYPDENTKHDKLIIEFLIQSKNIKVFHKKKTKTFLT